MDVGEDMEQLFGKMDDFYSYSQTGLEINSQQWDNFNPPNSPSFFNGYNSQFGPYDESPISFTFESTKFQPPKK